MRLFLYGFLVLAVYLPSATAVGRQVSSSDLLQRYMQARTHFLADQEVQRTGSRIPYRAPATLYLEGDTVRAWLEGLEYQRLLSSLPDKLPLFTVANWRKIPFQAKDTHAKAFSGTKWAFTGSSSLSPVDTMKTADLRSRFESVFGAPTLTLSDRQRPEELQREDIIQFEYWFLLNDSVRVAILDVNGPWDRGIVLAADQRVRSHLPVIKRDFLEHMLADAERAPFADYYYNVDLQAWYLTGYDGASFFDERIDRPDLNNRRYPVPRTVEPEPTPSANEPN